jgi:hypothetical protein
LGRYQLLNIPAGTSIAHVFSKFRYLFLNLHTSLVLDLFSNFHTSLVLLGSQADF